MGGRAYRRGPGVRKRKQIRAGEPGAGYLGFAPCGREAIWDFSAQDEFPDTVNDPEVFEKCRKRLRESGISWERLEAPMRWSEDFGWYLKKIPGCFLGIGAGERHPGLHTDSYEFPDALIEPAVSVLKAIVGLNC